MVTISKFKIPTRRKRLTAAGVNYIVETATAPNRLLAGKRARFDEFRFPPIHRLLILRTDGVGDLVLSGMALEAIRERFPEAHIVLAAASWSYDLAINIDAVNEVIILNAPWIVSDASYNNLKSSLRQIKSNNFDMAIDLRGDFRNILMIKWLGIPLRLGFDLTGCGCLLTHVIPSDAEMHELVRISQVGKTLGVADTDNLRGRVWIRHDDRRSVEKYLSSCGIGGGNIVVAVHVAARWPGRQWLAQRYAAICDRLVDRYGCTVVLTGSKADRPQANEVARLMKNGAIIEAGSLSLMEFAAFLERCDLFVGVDSGPMHMAAAVETPVVALFGAALAKYLQPLGSMDHVVTRQADFKCSPCAQTECLMPEASCMHAIQTDDVWQAISEILDQPSEAKYV